MAPTADPATAPRPADPTALDEAIARACARIAPTWPLDRFIAVNPFWGFTDAPLADVSARLSALAGSRLLMPRAWYREQWRAGRLHADHLREAVAQTGAAGDVARLTAALEAEPPAPARRARVTDVADAGRDLRRQPAWGDFVTQGLSQFCAAYFDQGQAQLGPGRRDGLYAGWRRQALADRGPALLMGLRGYHALAAGLPDASRALLATALADLEVAPAEYESYLTALLLDLNGWAAWCAYVRWTARLEGRGDDAHLADLLALRVAWEWLLYRAGGPALAARWRAAMAAWPAIDGAAAAAQADDWVWHRALEIAYQQGLCRALASAPAARPPGAPRAQAVFCIDVRSEVFRRALEAQGPALQTLGFAGFFGLPLEYQPAGAAGARPQLPGLLAPRLRAADAAAPAGRAPRTALRFDLKAAWKQFKTGPASGFGFVETVGPLYAAKLVGDGFGGRPTPPPERAGLSAAEHARRKPRLTGVVGGGPLDLAARCDLAAGVLRAMSLTRDFARLVALIGHGARTANNPHAAGLDCGACGGHTGEVNARAAAALLNEPEVRAGLAARGLDVPADTHFVAGLHDTTADEVELFDLDEAPASHAADLAALRADLAAAGGRARAERAPRLGLAGLAGGPLGAALAARGRDWSQVRPEWGLADNAAFVAAPRERVRHLDFAGRCFLHDYRHEEDADFATLELIMTAPMVVAHWINFQYYASTVDHERYGSGNKVLHNVVGGNLGVFEGNGGDLRIGLPLQSLHDGARWAHTPLRLSVFLEAPRPAIDAVLRQHAAVRALVEHEWLYLFQTEARPAAVWAYRRGAWARAGGPAA